ncbi:hypothetical protein WJX77_012474 [Trebouxia sp. C0004]
MYIPHDLSCLPDSIRQALEFRQLRLCHESWMYHEGSTDPSRSTLWLLGAKGSATPFHVDWAEANNIAWIIDSKWEEGDVLAVWVFVHPTIVNGVNKRMRKQNSENGFADGVSLTFAQVQQLQ